MRYVMGVDSGGTFTDCVILDEQGKVYHDKASSTPGDFTQGVLDSLANTVQHLGLPVNGLLPATMVFAHGTTIATNALLTRSGAKTGLITTRGFEDTLLIGRVHQKVAGLNEREIVHAAQLTKPVPIVPRQLIKGITERIDYQGRVLVPVDYQDVRQAVQELLQAGVEAIAVCLLSSYVNGQHEEEILAIIQEMAPEVYVTLSSRLAPRIGEYERAATSAINCFLGKVVSQYMDHLGQRLSGNGLTGPLLIMQSTGGVLPAADSGQRSVQILNSGPVGGIIASKYLGECIGENNIICTDVGGTSFDVGLISAGQPEYNSEPVAGRYHLAAPTVEVCSIGTGGGSIAWREEGTGILRVGPQSAGARPGPVCYGLGGELPTVTDADMILGYLDPAYFLGGRLALEREKAFAAFRDKIAIPLGRDVIEVAAAVYQISNSQMADLVRKVTIDRGHDPREFILFAYGGAGPTHAAYYAADVGVEKVVIPALAPVFSAFGCVVSDLMVFEYASFPMVLPVDLSKINEIYLGLEQNVMARLLQFGLAEGQIELNRSVEMRYHRQVHEVGVEVPGDRLGAEELETVLGNFERKYEQLYGQGTAFREAGMEMITYTVAGIGKTRKPLLSPEPIAGGDATGALKGKRPVYFVEFGEFVDTPIYDAAALGVGHQVTGHAVIEAASTTIVVPPGTLVTIDCYHNFILQWVNKS